MGSCAAWQRTLLLLADLVGVRLSVHEGVHLRQYGALVRAGLAGSCLRLVHPVITVDVPEAGQHNVVSLPSIHLPGTCLPELNTLCIRQPKQLASTPVVLNFTPSRNLGDSVRQAVRVKHITARTL